MTDYRGSWCEIIEVGVGVVDYRGSWCEIIEEGVRVTECRGGSWCDRL